MFSIGWGPADCCDGCFASSCRCAAESEIDHLVQILGLKRGSTVADVGAGSGEVSVAMAKSLGPEGKVYSTEIEAKLLNRIRSVAQKAETPNVIVIAGTEHATRLPSDCCDAIFLREVYHHLIDPISMDRDLIERYVQADEWRSSNSKRRRLRDRPRTAYPRIAVGTESPNELS